ncbi:MAG: germination protein YpeB [Bacillota bacterium]|nr:germination protein YpeB [Bacillota bacterium]
MRRVPWVAVTLLAILAVASLYWGFSQMRLKNQFLTRLENTYQRAFHELSFNMGAIDSELAKATVASTPEQAMIRLSAVWRQAYAAQEKIGQIPLGVVELQSTERFLARLGDAVLSIASAGVMPNEQEREMLEKLRTQARELSNSLIALQASVLGNNLRWTTLEIQTLNDTAPRDSQVRGQFRLVEDQVQQFPEVSFGEHVNVARPPAIAVTAEPITVEAAMERARKFVADIGADLKVISQEEVAEAEVPHYTFTFAHPAGNNRRITVEVVRNGGRVFQMFNERIPGQPVLLVADAEQRAWQFLSAKGINSVVLLGVEEWGDSSVFTFCHEENGMLFYPDLLRVRVSQDNGEILSYEGNGYTMYHRERGNFPERLTAAEAAERLTNSLTVVGTPQRVVIFDRRGVEVMCWEFAAQRGTEKFLIYVNAQNGREENIVRLDVRPMPTIPAWTTFR